MGKKYTMMIMIALVAIFLAILPVSAESAMAGQIVGQGATIFIGEEKLDISPAMGGYDTLGYWSAGADIIDTSPSYTIPVYSRLKSFTVTPVEFSTRTGNWYRINDDNKQAGLAFRVDDPSLSLSIIKQNDGTDVGGKTVVAGTGLTFEINTNILLDNKRGDVVNTYFTFTPLNGESYLLTPAVTNSPASVFVGEDNGLTVTFEEQNDANVNTWLYEFGDGDTSGLSTATHTYDAFGNYNVTLTTTNTVANPDIVSISSLLLKPSYAMNTTTGYMNIIVKSDGGTTYDRLLTSSNGSKNASLRSQFITSNPFYWNATWATNATVGGQRVYQSGTYTAYVESNLNNMKENYKSGGADYTGKTVSSISTVTLGSDTLKLTVNKDSIVRGKTFSVTIMGQASTDYKLWIKGTYPAGTTPIINNYQVGLTNINDTYANVVTDTSGTRTVEFVTSTNTKEQKYTIRAESMDGKKYDEVSINVVKGGLTLVANGDQSYYLGEEIVLSGTNSETETTYFFIIGPNLDTYGVSLEYPEISVITGDENSFVTADVDGDDTFSYTWATSGVDLDSGTYTIYGVSQPVNKNKLQDASYATVSVIIKKPYVSASSPRTIAKGDALYITGDAEGNPSSGVAIWILGKNYAKRTTQSVDSDGTYEYELPGGDTLTMSSGQYFVVVQHPMQNGAFDIIIDGQYVRNTVLGDTGTTIFKLYGSGSLQGSDAAEALIQAISDPNIDDTYTKLTILVEEPFIAIDTVGNRHVGDKFEITGKTNLAIDDEILMEVYSSSFKPTQKTQSGEFSGATGTIKVVKSEAGMNEFSFDIDASTFKIDEYIVVAQGIAQDATGTALFNVVEGASTTTPAVTPVATAPVIITVPPTAPPQTVPPTIPPTEIPVTTTTESPGFGAVFALLGLGAVAFVVMRRE